MIEPLDLYSCGPAIGDNLGYGVVMNASPCRIHFPNTSESRHSATLLFGLGEILFDNLPPSKNTIHIIGENNVHFTRRLLTYYNLEKYSCVPKIKLFPYEIGEAKKIISRFYNPIIFKDCANDNCSRSLPIELARRIVDLNPSITFLNFIDSKTLHLREQSGQKTEGIVTIKDIPLRIVAACYYLVGRYVGVDTGNYHLMLAVNGKCDVLIPNHGEGGYDYNMHLYPKDAFGQDEVRVNYIHRDSKYKRSIVGINYE